MSKVIAPWDLGASASRLPRLSKEFNFEPPREHGYDVVESIKAMHVGGQGVHCTGGNFLQQLQIQITQPKHYGVAVLPFTHHQNEPQPSNRRRARLILPCLGRTEIDMQAAEQFSKKYGVVQSSLQLPPASPFCAASQQLWQVWHRRLWEVSLR